MMLPRKPIELTQVLLRMWPWCDSKRVINRAAAGTILCSLWTAGSMRRWTMNLNCTCLSFSHMPTLKCIEIMALQWRGELRSTLFRTWNAAHLAICHTLCLPVPCQSSFHINGESKSIINNLYKCPEDGSLLHVQRSHIMLFCLFQPTNDVTESNCCFKWCQSMK